MIIKNSTRTIYQCLPENFWLTRSCNKCQAFFTKADYTHQNYQLTFTEVTKTEQNHLQVVVQLSHQTCCPGCLHYLKDLAPTKSTCPNPVNSTK